MPITRILTLLAIVWMGAVLAPSVGRANKPASPPSEQFLETEIDHVVIYQQGAQAERVSKVRVPLGISTLVFSELNTSIDPGEEVKRLFRFGVKSPKDLMVQLR